VFTRLQDDADVRCIVVAGEGGAFCAGGDISEYPNFRFEEASLRAFHEGDVWGGLQAMLDCDVPVIAQIEGPCMGAGVEIASCADIRIAGQSARFGAPIARLGFPMAPREAQLVARVAGEATAREFLLQAAVLDAGTMERRGFLHRVLPDADVPGAALDAAQAITRLAPLAARLNKQTMRALAVRGVHANRPSVAINTIADPYRYADSPEHWEGISAFLEKRKPAF
jgi:enoyl-CoA hydratase/carnithine racemase